MPWSSQCLAHKGFNKSLITLYSVLFVLKFKKKLFLYLTVPGLRCEGSLSFSTWDLVSGPRVKPGPSALKESKRAEF